MLLVYSCLNILKKQIFNDNHIISVILCSKNVSKMFAKKLANTINCFFLINEN